MPQSDDALVRPSEVAVLDAAYQPFPDFQDWTAQELPVGEIRERAFDQWADMREKAESGATAKAVDYAMRSAAFDTGAIEGLYPTSRGLTIAVATQAAAWTADVREASEGALPLFEAQLEGYEMALDAATQSRPITASWIRTLHEVATAPQSTYRVLLPSGEWGERPLNHGDYKADPNHVITASGEQHAYAPVDETSQEVQRLADQLKEDAFSRAHPIIQAAYAHYGLVAIHPFADGNGRAARILASVFTCRAYSVPLVLFDDQTERYRDALELADRRDHRPFVAFIADVTHSSVELAMASLSRATAPDPVDAAQQFHSLLTAQGGLTHQELDGVAQRLLMRLSEIAGKATSELGLPVGLEASQNRIGAKSPPEGFRSTPSDSNNALRIDLRSRPPADARTRTHLAAYVSTGSDPAQAVSLVSDQEEVPNAVFGLAELHPAITAAAEQRMRMVVDQVLGRALTSLHGAAEDSLRTKGFVTDS